MVRITLSVRKTLEETATHYFEQAKKARRKRDGALRTIERFTKELPKSVPQEAVMTHRQEWYERFRWSFTSDGVLLVGGKDAGSNETIIKKHLEPTDTVFHTEAPGSPFVLLKGERTADRVEQAAQLCAAYSAAWKTGLASTEVFWVLPEQVSKEANAGEYIGKGAFMVRGEKHFVPSELTLCLGLHAGRPAAGSAEIFEAGCVRLVPGSEKSSDIAAKLVKKFGFHPDDWLRLLPAGGATIAGWKKPRDHNS